MPLCGTGMLHRCGDTIPGPRQGPPIVPLPRNGLASSAAGGASPISPILFCLAKRECAAPGGRDKRFVSDFVPKGQSRTDGSRASRCPCHLIVSYRVRYTRYFVGADAYIGPCFPAFAGVGTRPGKSMKGFQQQAPLPLPRRSRPAAATLAAGPSSLCPTPQLQFAWLKAESFGAPTKTQRSGFRGERTSIGMSELLA